MAKKIALIFTGIIFLIANGAAIALSGFSFPSAKKAKDHSQAAIAVRDDVPLYQKTATRLFTKPYLKNLYDDFIYLEEIDTGVQRQKFVTGLSCLLRVYDSVDVYLLAHGNHMVKWLDEIGAAYRKRIRLVYNCGCNNARQHVEWRRLGVKYYLAHTGERSLSPVFFYFFIRRMANGTPFNKSIRYANRHTRILLRAIGFSKSKAEESCAVLYSF